MRLLHGRHDHVRRRASREEYQSNIGRRRSFHGRKHVSLRHLLPNRLGCSKSGCDDEGRCAMSDKHLSEVPFELERYELYDDPHFRLECDRREFLQALGGGILVCLVSREVLAMQPPGQRRRRGFGGAMPQEIGAWIHIGETGKITVYTGKVEIGQNIRTSLSQVVAEELRVGVDAIHLVMADTALTPFDMGTFGSATTPRMAAQLRKVAAATREVLIDLAAEQAKVDRGA